MNPITLVPTPTREVIDLAKAESMIDTWRAKLLEHQAAVQATCTITTTTTTDSSPPPPPLPLCDTLVLSNKSYTPEAAKCIASFLTSSSSLSLSSNQGDEQEVFHPPIVSGIQTAILSDIIASQPEAEGLQVLSILTGIFQNTSGTGTLKHVDLSDNAMGSKGVTACQEVIGGKAVRNSLESLKLCNNGLSEDTMEEVACLLTATAGEDNDEDDIDHNNLDEETNANGSRSCIAQNLKLLHFYNNMSGNDGCKSFAKILNHCTDKIMDIRMSGTRARAEGSRFIVQALYDAAQRGDLKNLIKLDLKDNSFAEVETYQLLTQALEKCTTLKELNLHDCVLHDEGIRVVCDALIQAKAPLEHLNLGGNDVTPVGAKSIARLLKHVNSTLVTFCASENDELTSRGVKRIVDVLDSVTLENVVFNITSIGKIGADAIVAMKDRVPNIKVLEMDENRIPLVCVEKLQEVYGDVLMEMEDNDEEEDADDDLEEEEEEEEEGEEEETMVPNDDAMDSLTSALGKVTV
eukprot:CAMPEP_0176487738 /NCGR_PEP_ID=MMETSP0200_2-20121128/6305_1 /TAXON_ID=947934 /ORGANISM="Chaetoceros sp., Strain GSL56" /LENGTH=519 /DNA_ID=CAMNT_0017884613 /DNA_START=94 /DNA_END=1653 /DNA_ORIENTATION=-